MIQQRKCEKFENLLNVYSVLRKFIKHIIKVLICTGKKCNCVPLVFITKKYKENFEV